MNDDQKFALVQEYLQRMDYYVNEQDINYFANIIELIDTQIYKR